MRRWNSAVVLVAIALALAGAIRAQGPIFRALEEPFPPEASGPLAWGDFDQDGDMDAVAFGSNVFLNDGDARFTPHPVPSVIPPATTWLEPYGRLIAAVADIDGDSFPDIVTTTGSLLVAWINQGNGVFVQAAPGLFPALPTPMGFASAGPSLILAGDVDADGDVDLVVPLGGVGPTLSFIWAPIQPQLLLNTPTGFVFATSQLPAIPVSANQGFLRDLDQDGDLDILLADDDSWTANCLGPSPTPPHCRAWLNAGSGTFTQSQALMGPSPRGFVALADVNGDGSPDLASSPFAATMICGSACQVALNLAGSFGAWASSPCAEAGPILAADLYGTGNEQLIRLTQSGVTVHQGGGTGLSAASQNVPLAAADGEVVDLDGDTDLDVVIRIGARTAMLLKDAQGTLIPHAGALWGPAAAQWTLNALDVEEITAVGDVDGNGTNDAVWFTTPALGQQMRVALNDGRGAFVVAPGFCGGGTCPVVSGNASHCPARQLFGLDVDGNGLLDLFTAQDAFSGSCPSGPSELHVNTGGAWALALTLPASPFSTTQVRQGDLDGDGLRDLLVAREFGVVPSLVLFNLGTQGWSAPVPLPTHATRDAALVDLDGDGDLDVVEANWLPGLDACAVLSNDGAGNFTPTAVPGVSAANARTVAAGDFDGDGLPDLVLDQQVWLNGPGLSFAAGPVLPVAQTIVQLNPCDADVDGDLDLVVGTRAYGASAPAVLLLNDGAGNFTLAETILNGYTSWVRAADLDHDGDVDLVVPGPRVLANVTRQIAKGTMVRAGRTCSLDLFGAANGSWHLFASTGVAMLPVPPIGTVLLDLATLQPLGSGTLSPSGTATVSTLLPPAPALVGFTAHLQALTISPAHVTNAEVMTVLDL